MLASVTKRMRAWAAGLLVTAYAFGILAPSLAFSFVSDVSIVHSLTEAHGGLPIPHFHHDDADQETPDPHLPGSAHHCCGVLSPLGLPPATDFSIADRELRVGDPTAGSKCACARSAQRLGRATRMLCPHHLRSKQVFCLRKALSLLGSTNQDNVAVL